MSVASGLPTKNFFVNMLTRDIDLPDSIFDLIDNSLDGVMRGSYNKETIQSMQFVDYSHYWVRILFDEKSFTIADNCGGIPRDRAENYAFRMGKPVEVNETDLMTVGVYGIGMKRAIFKIGRSGVVSTRHRSHSYKVLITESWRDDEKSWDFPIEDMALDALSGSGTKIELVLNDATAELWKDETGRESFTKKLINGISETYGLILSKGFKIYVNDIEVHPREFNVVFENTNEGSKIAPFFFSGAIEDVNVRIIVGLRRKIMTDDEIDRDNPSENDGAYSESGNTVICNDRVVLYKDKSHLTGWGEGGVPRFHNQYNGIVGYIFFESSNTEKLPLTTTKRGVDLSSAVYADAKRYLAKGIKQYTDYTNKWKGRQIEERKHSMKTVKLDVGEMVQEDFVIESIYSEKPTIPRDSQVTEGKYFAPNLPRPVDFGGYSRISFSEKDSDIQKVSSYIFEEDEDLDNPSPSEVGKKCFQMIFEKANGDV